MESVNIIIFLLLLFFTAIGYFTGMIFEKSLFNLENRIKKVAHIKKFHVHHDLAGLALIAISTILPTMTLKIALEGLGLGLFLHHITTEGFKFITKT